MMGNGQPPSMPQRDGASELLETARGSVRDTIGAIRNLEQLLRSIKVGPKALSAVIPDLHASCAPLLHSFRLLLERVQDVGEAPRTLEAFVAPRIVEIERALAESLTGTFNAKQRLSLEAAVTRIAGELDAARGLVELLEAVSSPAVPVQLGEVVRDATKALEGGEATAHRPVSVTLEVRSTRDTKVSPRLAGRLVRLAVGLVADRFPGETPQLMLDGCVLSVTAGAGRGEGLTLWAPRIIPCSEECGVASARAAGSSLSLEVPRKRAALTFPASE